MAKPNPTLPTLTEQQITRFWGYVDKSPGQGPQGECWEWKAGRNGGGYGGFALGYKTVGSHRMAYLLCQGELGTLSVLHRCDNPPCCNPDHLFLGTTADNMADKVAKQRQASGDKHGSRVHPECLPRGDQSFPRLHPERLARGERQGLSKLTEAEVVEMRRLYALGARPKNLAKVYSVTKSNVEYIVNGKTWRHLL